MMTLALVTHLMYSSVLYVLFHQERLTKDAEEKVVLMVKVQKTHHVVELITFLEQPHEERKYGLKTE